MPSSLDCLLQKVHEANSEPYTDTETSGEPTFSGLLKKGEQALDAAIGDSGKGQAGRGATSAADDLREKAGAMNKSGPETTTAGDDAHEKAEEKKEGGQSTLSGQKGEEALDAAIGDSGEGDEGDNDPERTSAADDPLEKAEAKKESG